MIIHRSHFVHVIVVKKDKLIEIARQESEFTSLTIA